MAPSYKERIKDVSPGDFTDFHLFNLHVQPCRDRRGVAVISQPGNSHKPVLMLGVDNQMPEKSFFIDKDCELGSPIKRPSVKENTSPGKETIVSLLRYGRVGIASVRAFSSPLPVCFSGGVNGSALQIFTAPVIRRHP